MKDELNGFLRWYLPCYFRKHHLERDCGQQTFVSLMSVLTVLWSLCQGCPNEPGPSCADELPNAAAVTNRLKKSLRDFYRSLVEGGYGGREFQGPVCILSSTSSRHQPTDLDTIDTRLCQYTKCFQHFANIIRYANIPQSRFESCQKYLHQLKNTIKKMKRRPAALCATQCTISWTDNDSEWEEVTKGPRLAKELLTYLDQLELTCS
ncbi:hypothetical protein JRQ81_000126 [Phrynocephalus forsythii]|uniref:Uncharacterized protein n=1 Tax=Phrynocephalus forsythii TaxID=171643 RepID=A0A9Q1B7R1_9SAUR|nr:hypothetical protein JRQ81_000126 [Phrynocephalus forsythii]